MQQPLTADLGAFVAGLRFDALPPGAAAVVRQGFTDLVGCMIAGRNEEAPQVLRTVLQPADGRATLYFSGVGASLPEAVWINGTAAHALDYDDGRLLGHIGGAGRARSRAAPHEGLAPHRHLRPDRGRGGLRVPAAA